MTIPKKDAGTILVLLNRLNNQRLPRALRLKKQVDRGECLGDYELRFLQQVFEETGTARGLAVKYPEYQDLVDRMAALYAEITRKAAENAATRDKT